MISVLNRTRITQEKVVIIASALLFVLFSLFLTNFFSASNLIGLVRNVSVLGILGVGMGVVIIARGVDLSIISILAISAAYFIEMLNQGTPILSSILIVLALVVLVGAINGILIAYAEIPAIFATLAMGLFVYGFGRSLLIGQDVTYIPSQFTTLLELGNAKYFSVPLEVYIFVCVAIIAALFLKFTKFGRYTYYIGDNATAARNIGIPVRPMIVLQYVISAVIALIAGAIIAGNLQSMNTRIVNSTLLYDVILIVVLGGIGLSGGKGGIRNVIFGALLIGIMINGMTILDLQDTYQNLIKALILLAAIVIDATLNPRDEQTEKQGDI